MDCLTPVLTHKSLHNTHTDMATENNIQAVQIPKDVCDYTQEVGAVEIQFNYNLKSEINPRT